LKLHARRRRAANRIDVASRLSVRTTAACRLFPSGEALPSTTSAEVAFFCSVASESGQRIGAARAAYNMKRVMQILGVGGLMAAMPA
jgi:hypothetical protein